MSTANMSWVLPTTRTSGRPLTVDEIAGVEVSISGDLGANWKVATTKAPPDLTHSISDLEVGTWIFRFIVIDTNGKRSGPFDKTAEVEDDSDPSPITDVTIVIT